MLYGLLVTLFVFVCFLLIIVILIQQGKGGLGLGSLGGGAQMLFGGSGGQDVFQKITWILGAIFIFGSLGLFILGSKKISYGTYVPRRSSVAKTAPASAPAAKDSKKVAAPKAQPVKKIAKETPKK